MSAGILDIRIMVRIITNATQCRARSPVHTILSGDTRLSALA
jgi:hypothetical protein